LKLYTKIFIGMAAGILIGVAVGPESIFLPADQIQVKDPSVAPLLEAPGGGASRYRLPPEVPTRMALLESRSVGGRIYHRVSVTISERHALKDRAGLLRRGEVVTAWVAGSKLPAPTSTLGATITGWLDPVGQVFIRLIKMVVVPLVFASLLVGVAGLGDLRRLGRLGGKTIGYFLLTTTIAITIGLTFANVVKPGAWIDPVRKQALLAQYEGDAGARTSAAADKPSTADTLIGIIPENPAGALAAGEMLQIIFFACFFGVALTLIPKERSEHVIAFFDAVNEAMVMCVNLVMKLAPYGVLALVAVVVGQSGVSMLTALLVYTLTVLAGLFTHTAVIYTLSVRIFGRIRVLDFWRAARPAQLLAFSTSSSSATLPVTMRCAQQNLGISNQVSSFVLPLGSTINMDGTALYQGVAAVFIAQVFDIPLGPLAQAQMVLTATLASIGAAGVPGVGMITLALVLTSIGVPTVGVALILGVDRILDMFRTATNVTGDLSAAVMVAATEGETLGYRAEG